MNIFSFKSILVRLFKKRPISLSPIDRLVHLEYSESVIPELYDIFQSIKGQLPIVNIEVLEDCHIFRQRRNEGANDFGYIHEPQR